jgi:hypothetical protein
MSPCAPSREKQTQNEKIKQEEAPSLEFLLLVTSPLRS